MQIIKYNKCKVIFHAHIDRMLQSDDLQIRVLRITFPADSIIKFHLSLLIIAIQNTKYAVLMFLVDKYLFFAHVGLLFRAFKKQTFIPVRFV